MIVTLIIILLNATDCATQYFHSIPGVPKKRNGGFSVSCELKISYFLTSLDKASSAEENDTKIINFGWVILNLCPLLEIQSFSNFAWFLRPMSKELCRGKAFHLVFWGSPLIHGNIRNMDGLPQNTLWKLLPDTILRSSVTNRAKFENDCISRNGHRIKITQPKLMILVSFSYAEVALSNDVKNITILDRKILKICHSAFFGHPIYISYWLLEDILVIGYNQGMLFDPFQSGLTHKHI